MKVEIQQHFLLECPTYDHIKSRFQDICNNIDLLKLLIHQNYGLKIFL